MKALLVDDFAPILKFEFSILDRLGFEVSFASNGKEALTRLEDEPLPDVILLDWNMPEMDGMGFVQVVREQPRFDEIAIVMVTTEIDAEHIARALAAGANEYLMKPFNEACLLDKLRLIRLLA